VSESHTGHHIMVRPLLVSDINQDYIVMIRGWLDEGWLCYCWFPWKQNEKLCYKTMVKSVA